MKTLIQVVRGRPDHGTAINIPAPGGEDILHLRTGNAEVIQSRVMTENSNFSQEGEFFLMDSREADEVAGALAHQNPGHEVRVYAITAVYQCPAAPMVTKKVSEHGVLPA